MTHPSPRATLMDAISQLNSALVGRYAIEREIGAGGMATVYLARDRRHNRNVALKVLNPELGAVLGVERFLSEIQVTATLQHPNLLPLFDSGDADGVLFYVMPFVEGESLRARLLREKQLPVDEALRIAVAVAGALDYAHSHGVIHRDLKPENILIQAGQPVVADFGIALAVSRAGGARVTQTGLSLGTPQYMSPEQATGDRAIDARSDIYSLGVVLYEMLTGDPPYLGSTAQAVIAKVLTERPRGVRTTRATVPAHIEAAIARALEKLPADRFITAREFVEALQGQSALPARADVNVPAPLIATGPRRRAAAIAAAAGVVALTGGAWLVGRASGRPEEQVVRANLESADAPMAPTLFVGPPIAISADGKRVAYTTQSASGPQIAVRRLDELTAHAIPSSVGGVYPVFSVDGRSIVFFTGGSANKVSVDGGPASLFTHSAVTTGAGASMGPNDVLVMGYPTTGINGLGIIDSPNGEVRALTIPDTTHGELLHRFPLVLADGKTVLFNSFGRSASDARIALTTLTGGPHIRTDVEAVFPLGFVDDVLIYVRSDGSIQGVRFDLERRRSLGRAVLLETNVRIHGNGSAEAALSRNGTLVYVMGSASSKPSLVDMKGNAQPLFNDAKQFAWPRFSPDGGRVVLTRADVTSDIWIYDVRSKVPTRLTRGEGTNDRPEWNSDGTRVVYRSNRAGRQVYWWQPADGTGKAELAVDAPTNVAEAVLTPDGAGAVYRTTRPATNMDLIYQPMSGGTPTPIAASQFAESMPAISPNGKFIAYISNDAGLMDVYVQPLASSAARIPVSTGGGGEPRWSRDGSRIFYRADRHMIAATLTTSPTLSVTRRDTLFADRFNVDPWHANYDVAPDGQHFLMLEPVDNNVQIVVVHNWARVVRERMTAERR